MKFIFQVLNFTTVILPSYFKVNILCMKISIRPEVFSLHSNCQYEDQFN